MVLGAGAPELRLLVEAQADPPSAAAYWQAGRAVSRFVGALPGAQLERLSAVEELFVPTEGARFRSWHAVAFRPGVPPRARVYLCANPDGSDDLERSEARLQRALDRLGLHDALAAIDRRPGDLLTILSLDLDAAGRTKIYRLRPACRAVEAVPRAAADDANLLARCMLGDEAAQLGWLTCWSFVDRGAGAAPSTALHLSIYRHLGEREVVARVEALCAALRIDATAYRQVVATLAPRHHFVSLQRQDGAPRVTVYLLPEAAR